MSIGRFDYSLTKASQEEHVYGEPRSLKSEGWVYIIRDVWERRDERGELRDLVRCEYATKGKRGKKVWKPCIEGVQFKDIQPFERVS